MYKVAMVFAGVVLMLQGCGGTEVKLQKAANVTSSPSGAEVFAQGKMLGVTPLIHDLYSVFPANWKNSTYQAQGELVVRKKGCKDFTLEVSDYILSQPVHADLVCGESPAVAESAQTQPASGGAEKRLIELKSLYDKGLISKDEFDETRKRILNTI